MEFQAVLARIPSRLVALAFLNASMFRKHPYLCSIVPLDKQKKKRERKGARSFFIGHLFCKGNFRRAENPWSTDAVIHGGESQFFYIKNFNYYPGIVDHVYVPSGTVDSNYSSTPVGHFHYKYCSLVFWRTFVCTFAPRPRDLCRTIHYSPVFPEPGVRLA